MKLYMKSITKYYLLFVVAISLLMVYFCFVQYFYILCLYDTYYMISYFYFALLIFIIGTVIYFMKFRKIKRKL